MIETPAIDPRWGSEGREVKADAIWNTMLLHCGAQAVDGMWLDLGCGSGGIAASLAPRVGRMVGSDPEPWSRWREFEAQHANLQFYAGNDGGMPNAPLPDGSFEVVVCNQVYEHVPDPQALLAEISRVLKPGGYCYFAGPNLLWPIEPHVFWPFVHWLPRGFALWLMRALGSTRMNDLDAWSATYWSLTRWFKRHQFSYANAIHARIHAASMAEQGKGMWRLAAWLPGWCIDVMTPLSPAFVFVLRKATSDSGSIT